MPRGHSPLAGAAQKSLRPPFFHFTLVTTDAEAKQGCPWRMALKEDGSEPLGKCVKLTNALQRGAGKKQPGALKS